MFSPQGVLEKGAFGGNGDARLELVWKVEGISPNHAGVKCLISVWQICVDTGMWPAQTSLTNPEGDKSSHIIKDKVLAQDGTMHLDGCIISAGFICFVCQISFPMNCLSNSLCPSTPFAP